ncbi:hypothetical protein QWY86_15245 [Pedobacter aquatilis]|uniref:hypothetical protein n=1 Tax=Pedobacter aquatilis TaxID=351343 RepID=UPI0025B52198|nr:hypothetical protein [Pedobacter aquatilis]MDN3588037.1 hypothetical protein [Pedobacter aquatilis]
MLDYLNTTLKGAEGGKFNANILAKDLELTRDEVIDALIMLEAQLYIRHVFVDNDNLGVRMV